jgi:hypothetical protein
VVLVPPSKVRDFRCVGVSCARCIGQPFLWRRGSDVEIEGRRLNLRWEAVAPRFFDTVGMVLTQLLYGVAPADWRALLAAAAMLAIAAAVAACLPARRASRVDPMQVLRAE